MVIMGKLFYFQSSHPVAKFMPVLKHDISGQQISDLIAFSHICSCSPGVTITDVRMRRSNVETE